MSSDFVFIHEDLPFQETINEFFDLKPGSNSEAWPKLSADLNPVCFFVWGYIKSKIFHKPIGEKDKEELKLRIHHAFMEITPDMLKHAAKAYEKRLKMVVDKNGNWIDQHKEEKEENSNRASDMETIDWLTRLEKRNFSK